MANLRPAEVRILNGGHGNSDKPDKRNTRQSLPLPANRPMKRKSIRAIDRALCLIAFCTMAFEVHAFAQDSSALVLKQSAYGAASLSTPTSELKIELREAIQMGLENSDVVRKLTGGEISVDAATWYEPQAARERALEALADFDVAFESEVGYRWLKNPPASFIGPGLQVEDRRDIGLFNAGLAKRWQSGTVTRVAYRPEPSYLYFPNGSSGFNPNHVSAVEFSVRQALLQGASAEVNTAPIRIEQLNGERSSWEFKQAIIEFVRSIEQAYWELQAATAARQSLEQQISSIDEIVRLEEAAMKAERAAVAEVAKARTQRHEFRQVLLAVQAKEKSRERALRTLIGLPLEDYTALQLDTLPSEASVVIDLPSAVSIAMNEQPRLVRRRLVVQIRETEMGVARDSFLPKFDVSALYRANGLSDELGDSLDQLITNDFHDWEVGASLSVPLQRNGATARIQAAEIQLQRERAVLREEARVVSYNVTNAVRDLQSLHEQYREARARGEQGKQWLEIARIRYKTPPPNRGGDENRLLVALDDYLDALREVADASAEAASILADYNTALARLEEFQGTLLESRDILLSDDPCHNQDVQHILQKSHPEPINAATSEALKDPPKDNSPPSLPLVPPPTKPTDSSRRYPLPSPNQPTHNAALSIVQPTIVAHENPQPTTLAPAGAEPGLGRYRLERPSEIPQHVPPVQRLPMSTLSPHIKK